jgi:hypothetical protein
MENILDYGKNYDNLVSFNIPDVTHTPKFQSFIDNDRMYRRSLFKNHPHRCFIYFGNNKLRALEEIKHTEEVIKLLNNEGLNIYLFEPLCFKQNKDEEYSDYFYSEFPFNPDENIYCEELESILLYQKNNNLTNINVHTCDYNVEKYLNYYSKTLKLICNDLFLTHFGFEMPYVVPENIDFTHKFLCTNWRYTKVRHLISSYLMDKPSFISWYFDAPFENLKNNINWMDLDLLKTTNPNMYYTLESGCNLLSIKSPLNIDKNITINKEIYDYKIGSSYPNENTETKELNFAISNISNFSIDTFYKNIFCEIVTESRFAQPTGNISEKTIRAIFYQKPFILVAPPYSLEHLKNYGFKTFSDFWDESYDYETNHEKRLIKIFNLIDFINSLSKQETHDLYSQMQSIFKHNTNMLYKGNFIKHNKYNKIMFS